MKEIRTKKGIPIITSRDINMSIENYKELRSYSNKRLKNYLKNGILVHISTTLLPQLDKKGKIKRDNKNNIIYSNLKTKGTILRGNIKEDLINKNIEP